MASDRRDVPMSLMGKAHLVIVWTVDSSDEGEWDRIFTSHGEWMTGHPRDGDVALLSCTISKGPERSNPLDPSSEPTGKTMFVLDEYYESPAGITRHWEEAPRPGRTIWARSFREVPGLRCRRCTAARLSTRSGNPPRCLNGHA